MNNNIQKVKYQKPKYGQSKSNDAAPVRATRSGKVIKAIDQNDLPPIDSADEDEDGYQSESMIEDSSKAGKRSGKKSNSSKMSPIKSKGKIKKGQTGASTGSQDQTVPVRNILAGATTFSKKRNFVNFQEASESFIEDSSKANQPSDELNLKTSVAKPNKYDLWTSKYTPFNLDSHVINKKKKEEFVQICTQDNKAKILFLQGPSGCGKNSMIDAFGEQYNYEVIRYTDQKSKNVIDVYGAGDTFGNEFGDQSEDDRDQWESYYPDDLENLIYFIRQIMKSAVGKGPSVDANGSSVSAIGTTQPKSTSFSSFASRTSSFAKKKAGGGSGSPSGSSIAHKNTQISTQETTILQPKKFDGKLYVFNSLPECLKIWSKQKPQLMRDFNQILEQAVHETRNVKSPLFIFTFSDPNEQTKQYLNKLFSQKINQEMRHQGFVKQLSINQPTDKEIEKVLHNIVNKELQSDANIAINKFQVDDIKIKANRDLRSAIQLLQFFSIGRLNEMVNVVKKPTKKLKLNSQDSNGDPSGTPSKKPPSAYKRQQEVDNSRDNNLNIFHALGKFLYNKRIDPKDKQPRQMTYKEQKSGQSSGRQRPKFYEKHSAILNKTLLEDNVMSLYLHENMLNFYGDIEDISNTFEVYSSLDAGKAKIEYQYGHMQYLAEISSLNSLVESMAVTEYNWHGHNPDNKGHGGYDKYEKYGGYGGRQSHDKTENKGYGNKMTQMQVPQFYEHVRNLRQNISCIRDLTKDKQIFENSLYSDDILIRSSRENQKQVLPYVSQLDKFVDHHCLHELSQLSSYKLNNRDYHRAKHFGQDDCGMKDDFNKEQQLDKYLQDKEKAAFRKQQLTDANWKKNEYLGSNVMQINQNTKSSFPVIPVGLNIEKEMYLKNQQDKKPDLANIQEEVQDDDDLDLDEDELGDMLEEMDLDEDIEDGIAKNDLGKALNQDKNKQRMGYI